MLLEVRKYVNKTCTQRKMATAQGL